MPNFCDRAWKVREDSRLSGELAEATTFVRNAKRTFHLARKRVAEMKKRKYLLPLEFWTFLAMSETCAKARVAFMDAIHYKERINREYEALW